MKILATLTLMLAMALPSLGATTWPAGTNVANTFFLTNQFRQRVTFGTPATNFISDSGSAISGLGFTNFHAYGDGDGLTNLGMIFSNVCALGKGYTANPNTRRALSIGLGGLEGVVHDSAVNLAGNESGTNSVCIGVGASIGGTNTGSIAIGYQSDVFATDAIGIGKTLAIYGDRNIYLGPVAADNPVTPKTNRIVIGGYSTKNHAAQDNEVLMGSWQIPFTEHMYVMGQMHVSDLGASGTVMGTNGLSGRGLDLTATNAAPVVADDTIRLWNSNGVALWSTSTNITQLLGTGSSFNPTNPFFYGIVSIVTNGAAFGISINTNSGIVYNTIGLRMRFDSANWIDIRTNSLVLSSNLVLYGNGAGLSNVTSQAILSTDVPLTARGAGSQTTNLFEAQNSSGAVLAYINSAGIFNGNGGGLTNLTAANFTGVLNNTNMPDPLILNEIDVGTLVLTNAPVLNLGSSTNYTGPTTSTNGLATTNWVGANYQTLQLAATTNGFVGATVTNGLAGTNFVMNATNDLTTVFRAQSSFATNTSTMAPDFNLAYSRIGTNAAFAFLLPINVSSTLAQTAVILVTNITGSAIAVTPPANVHSQGTWYITNATTFTFWNYGSFFTNAIAFPLY